jgi:Glycosyltransferase 61
MHSRTCCFRRSGRRLSRTRCECWAWSQDGFARSMRRVRSGSRSSPFLGTDRFRPELLRLVPPAYGVPEAGAPRRKVFVGRANAARRRLANEDEVWPLLESAGFQRVLMEELTFEAQVSLMRETAVLCAPHGAGLTNMMFCPTGARVVEIADLGFPNPNFYALAAALGHRYRLLPADSLGDGHPLEKDLRADPGIIRDVLPCLME